MSVLWLPMGPPASGKSTLARQMVERDRLAPDAIVSPDEFRGILTGDIGDMSENDLVFDLCRQIMVTRLSHQLDVWMDATNTNEQFRKDLIAAANLPGVVVVGVQMTTPVEECLLRNELRDRTVPGFAMDRLISQFKAIDWLRTGVDVHAYDYDLLDLDYSTLMQVA